MTKVAIITRTKDRPVFLRRAIESVSAQTAGDYVHVIVNDGGKKDEVQSVIELFSDDIQQKIKLFHRKTPSGAPDTIFNESIDRADSTYVAIHDDDDTWHPEFLERTLHVLDSGKKAVVVRTNRIYETFKDSKIKRIKSEPYMPEMVAVSLYRQCIENQLTPIALIFSRDAYKAIGKFDSSLPVAGDWEFGIRFLKAYDVEFLDPGFALAYYHHRKNISDNSYASHNHRKVFTSVSNKYLREDLKNGSLGLGYIMSKLKYDMDVRHKIIKKIIPKTIIKKLR